MISLSPARLASRYRETPVVRHALRAIADATCRGYVYVATTGHSGTTSLTEIFRGDPRCCGAHHTNVPMNGWAVSAYEHGELDVLREHLRRHKLPQIYRHAAGHRCYVETNHLFMKSFASLMPEFLGDRLKVIRLRRDPLLVATSLVTRGPIPGVNADGFRWLGDYRAPRVRLPMVDVLEGDPRFAHGFYKAVWHTYEIEARYREFKRENPGIVCVEIGTAELNDREAISQLVRDLGIGEPHPGMLARVGTRANVGKKKRVIPAEAAHAAEFVELCEARLAQVSGDLSPGQRHLINYDNLVGVSAPKSIAA
ncbi:MAG: hypothetical protein AAGK09_11360 [Planctomycetota bacterium]